MTSQLQKTSMLLLLAASMHVARAQPPCSGVGLSLSDVAHKRWYRPAPQPVDFTKYLEAGPTSFSAPGPIWPVAPGEVYLLDGNRMLDLQIDPNGGLTGGSPNLGASVAVADDGRYIFALDARTIFVRRPLADRDFHGEQYSLPTNGTPYDIMFDGNALWFSQAGAGLNSYFLTRAVYTRPANITSQGSMTFTSQKVTVLLNKIAFDGRYIWGAASDGSLYKYDGFTQVAHYTAKNLGAPKSLTFDGFSMWVTTVSSPSIYRFRTSDGSQLSTLSSTGNAGGLAFDGSTIWGADFGSAALFGRRACDAAAMPPFKVPAKPEYAAFDGVNYWVSSPTSKTVSVR